MHFSFFYQVSFKMSGILLRISENTQKLMRSEKSFVAFGIVQSTVRPSVSSLVYDLTLFSWWAFPQF